MGAVKKLNLIGVVSPFCLLEFKAALAGFRPGQALEVSVQDPEVVDDLIRLVNRSEDRLLELKRVGKTFRLTVERAGGQARPAKEEA